MSNSSACSALGTKPKVILSSVSATVVAGASRVSASSTAAGSSTVSSSALPPQAARTNDKTSKIRNDFFVILPPLAYKIIILVSDKRVTF